MLSMPGLGKTAIDDSNHDLIPTDATSADLGLLLHFMHNVSLNTKGSVAQYLRIMTFCDRLGCGSVA